MAKPDVPDDTTVDFSLEFVWKATSFERMNNTLKLFKDYSASISGYLFHVLLGHEVCCMEVACWCVLMCERVRVWGERDDEVAGQLSCWSGCNGPSFTLRSCA